MRQFTDFSFNKESSTMKGVFNGNTSDGLYEEGLFAERTVNIEMLRNQPKGYFLNADRTPFKFSLRIGSYDEWTRQKIDDIVAWFDVDYFKEFYFLEESDRVIFAMPTGTPTFTHTGAGQGYLTVEMQSQSPYVFSPRHVSGEYNMSTNTELGTEINLYNSGHSDLYPMIRIRKVGDGNVSIKNETNFGKIFEIRNLMDTEEVFIDNQTKEIKSNLPRVYHYDDHNGVWFYAVRGNNILRVFGTCFIEFEYRYRYKSTL